MLEIDFLAVGDGERSGDAIALRFTHPTEDRYAHVVIDAGYKRKDGEGDGDKLVAHVREHYGVGVIDLAIVTHPDGDHIGGMGQVLRGLVVRELWVHDLAAHGGDSLPAAKAVRDLAATAHAEGTAVREPWAGTVAFGGALRVLGPDRDYYNALVAEQLREQAPRKARELTLAEATRAKLEKFVSELSFEVPFFDKGTSPRNNSSVVLSLDLDDRHAIFTGDAGVPALERALDELDAAPAPKSGTRFVQVPHHGSRHNGSSALLDRLLGPKADLQQHAAFVSVVADAPKHPSPRIINGFQRRGFWTKSLLGQGQLLATPDAPDRPNWNPTPHDSPMDESLEEE